ncbi:MAG TPA: hypothetical protein VGV61_08375, partial [Thermoanaerobaculia bacterium]|nr:hypothetical protein [Thermoanaerobaculia bacterium]
MVRSSRFARLPATFLGLALAYPVVAAALAVDARTQVAPYVSLYTAVGVAAGRDGGFVVVWEEDSRVYARAYDADAAPRGGRQLVSGLGAKVLGLDPRIAALPDGNFVVVWVFARERFFPSVFPEVVRAQILSPQAELLGQSVDVGFREKFSSVASGPEVIVDPFGAAVVAWRVGALQGRRLFTVHGDEGPVLVPGEVFAIGDGEAPVLAPVPGGFAAAWIHHPSRSSPYRVVIRPFAVDGTGARPLRDELRIDCTPSPDPKKKPSSIVAVRITSDASGRFVVGWQEALVGQDPDRVIRALRFAADGTPVEGTFDILSLPAPPEDGSGHFLYMGDLSARADGTLLAMWGLVTETPIPCERTDPADICPPPNTDGVVFARAFNAGGDPRGPELQVASEEYTYPRVASARADGWVVTYQDFLDFSAATLALDDCGGAGPEGLCLGGRFLLTASWKTD